MKTPTAKKAARETGLVLIARQRLAKVVALLDGERMSVERVHQLRTGSRRLTEVVGALKKHLPSDQERDLRRTLRGLRRGAGEVRDLDVLLHHLARLTIGPKLGQAVAMIRKGAPQRRAALEKPLRKMLRGKALDKTLRDLAIWLEAQKKAVAFAKVLAARQAKRRTQMEQQWTETGAALTPEKLHAARIATKKLRYTMELRAESAGDGHKNQLKFLQQVQGELGEHHDVEVMLAAIQQTLDRHPKIKDAACEEWREFAEKKAQEQAKRAAIFVERRTLWMGR